MVFLIECVSHNYTRWDVKEQKDLPVKLYLWNGDGPPMAPDIIWLQSITRTDSGTWFTTSEEKAAQYKTEDEADEKLVEIILELGYLPADVILTKIEPKGEVEGG